VRIDHRRYGFLGEPAPIGVAAGDKNSHREHDALAAALIRISLQTARSGTHRCAPCSHFRWH
jgi:hypothetical protein